jgi:SAM-dependent methyltransferase
MSVMPSQAAVDAENARFWDEPCGTQLARSLGLLEPSEANLRRFDEAFLRLYPYLESYVPRDSLAGRHVLEIGIGYGTLGQLLAECGCRYYGLDIAANPVALMEYRLARLTPGAQGTVQHGSALSIPHGNETFDYVYSIGCLHHTGDIGRAVGEVHRVLRHGGKAIVMLYNRHSFRQLTRGVAVRLRTALRFGSRVQAAQQVRGLYDADSTGEAAPCTEFVSKAEARRLFAAFRHVEIHKQNFDQLVLLGGRIVIPRERFLTTLAHVVGLDLYILATK